MKKAIISGVSGLVGSSSVRQLSKEGFEIIGIDNDSRKMMFGEHASTKPVGDSLLKQYPNLRIYNTDIRDLEGIEKIFKEHKDADFIQNLAASPAHEWANQGEKGHRLEDFYINAVGTINILESFYRYCPDAVFIQCSTSKVYGDVVNKFPYIEYETRYDLPKDHLYYEGFDENIGWLDNNLRSFFGASKTCGDITAQEYGKYLNLKVGIFRPACIAGSLQKSDRLHGFLAHLAKCIATGDIYYVNGNGKYIRDTIHADDLVTAFYEVYKDPTYSYGETYNMGAGRNSTLSIIEAIKEIEEILGKRGNIVFTDKIRKGDHISNIFSTQKFKMFYKDWNTTFENKSLLEEICSQYK